MGFVLPLALLSSIKLAMNAEAGSLAMAHTRLGPRHAFRGDYDDTWHCIFNITNILVISSTTCLRAN